MRKKTHNEYIVELAEKNPNIEAVEEYIGANIQILHRCKICGYGSNKEWAPTPNHVLQGGRCPVCTHKIIGPSPEYKNSIWASEYRKIAEYYGVTEYQMKTIMPMSKKKIEVTCPICGYKKLISPHNLFCQGFSCSKCSDGISYPEKFIMSLLNQLNISYVYDKPTNWSQNKRYDFVLNNYNCIIETHGLQHYEECTRGKSLKEEQENDLLKEKLAKENGVINYIIIDCRESNLNWIKNSVMNSDIPNLLKFIERDVNWEKCSMDAVSSRIKIASDLWNNNKTIGEIAKIMNTHHQTIWRWLKKANRCGLCDYTPEKGHKRSIHYGSDNYNACKIIRLSDLKIYNCIKEAAPENNITYRIIWSRCQKQKDFMYYDEWLAQQND